MSGHEPQGNRESGEVCRKVKAASTDAPTSAPTSVPTFAPTVCTTVNQDPYAKAPDGGIPCCDGLKEVDPTPSRCGLDDAHDVIVSFLHGVMIGERGQTQERPSGVQVPDDNVLPAQ